MFIMRCFWGLLEHEDNRSTALTIGQMAYQTPVKLALMISVKNQDFQRLAVVFNQRDGNTTRNPHTTTTGVVFLAVNARCSDGYWTQSFESVQHTASLRVVFDFGRQAYSVKRIM